MKRIDVLLVIAGAIALGGCSSTVLRNTDNAECERRVHSDRERCLRNNKSSDEAMAARQEAARESKAAWESQTLQRIEAEAGK